MLCPLIAVFRHSLGSAEGSAFLPVALTLPLVAARLAGQAAPAASLTVAVLAFIVGLAWYAVARLLDRRAPDPFFLTLLAFQLFFFFSFVNTLLPSAGPFYFSGLAFSQKLSTGLQLLGLFMAALWYSHAAATPAHETSAPSRVLGFLRKRRLPLRIAGLLCMLLAAAITYWTAQLMTSSPTPFPWLTMPLLFVVWIALDAGYLAGRALWMRIH